MEQNLETIILETAFAKYFLHDDHNILEQCWTNSEAKMSSEAYKEDMWNYLKCVKEHQTSLALIDLKQFNFSIEPELQQWVDTNIAVESNKIVKKIAFVMPSDFVESLSVEQTMEENEGAQHDGISYFDNREEALNWLLK